MLDELNREGMHAIDLNHKLGLKLLDKVRMLLRVPSRRQSTEVA